MLIDARHSPFARDEEKILAECQRLQRLAQAYIEQCGDRISKGMRPRVERLLGLIATEVAKPDRQVRVVEATVHKVVDNISLFAHPENCDHGVKWFRANVHSTK
ncbi:MAG: hypothetical protein WAK23_06490 [Terriglobales bacterium]